MMSLNDHQAGGCLFSDHVQRGLQSREHQAKKRASVYNHSPVMRVREVCSWAINSERGERVTYSAGLFQNSVGSDANVANSKNDVHQATNELGHSRVTRDCSAKLRHRDDRDRELFLGSLARA